LGTILVEKVIDSISYAFLFLFLLLLIPLPDWVGQSAAFFVGVTLLISIGVIFLSYRRTALSKIIRIFAPYLPAGWQERVLLRIDSGLTSLDIIQDRSALAKLGLCTVFVWGTAILNNHLILQAVSIDLSWMASLLILVVLQVGISIPSVPGKIGIFEYTCILALSVFGIEQTVALGYGLVLHALVFIPTTLSGLIIFWGMGLMGVQKRFQDGVV
jgi:uncharacterized protein (TIRG00374 family)